MWQKNLSNQSNVGINFINDAKEQILRSNFDIFVMTSIKNIGALSGYDLLVLFKDKFQTNISVGTIYAQLYSLERKQLIECRTDTERSRKYTLTTKGLRTIDVVISLKSEFLALVDSIFSP
jgi:DNA-binding PadR family transcriptional regulator